MDSNHKLEGAVETLQRWCAKHPRWKNVVIDRKQGGSGYIRAQSVRDGEVLWSTKIDLDVRGRRGKPEVEPNALKHLVLAEGEVKVQPLRAIIARKIEKTFSERREGRDLYDLGWLLAKHPEEFGVEMRTRVAEALITEVGEGYGLWHTALEEDKAVQRAKPREVLENIWDTASNDPHVVGGEYPESQLKVRGRSIARGTADAVLAGPDGTANALIIAEGPLNEVCRTVARYGLEEKGKVLEIERTLEQSLAQARAAERARTRDG